MPGKKYRSIKRPAVYRALRRRNMSKSRAAAISNAGRTRVARSRMARRAARTRRYGVGRRRR